MKTNDNKTNRKAFLLGISFIIFLFFVRGWRLNPLAWFTSAIFGGGFSYVFWSWTEEPKDINRSKMQ